MRKNKKIIGADWTYGEYMDFCHSVNDSLSGKLFEAVKRTLKSLDKSKALMQRTLRGRRKFIPVSCEITYDGNWVMGMAYLLFHIDSWRYNIHPVGKTKVFRALDTDTGGKAYVIVSNCVLVFSAHAVARFRERILGRQDGMDEVECLKALAIMTLHNSLFFEEEVYGESGNKRVAYLFTRELVFLGYIEDNDRFVIHCETCYSHDMFIGKGETYAGILRESLDLINGYPDELVEALRKMRDDPDAFAEEQAKTLSRLRFSREDLKRGHERNKAKRMRRLATMSGARWSRSGYVSKDDGEAI